MSEACIIILTTLSIGGVLAFFGMVVFGGDIIALLHEWVRGRKP